MKKNIIMLLIFLTTLLSGCKDAIETYKDKDNRLNFNLAAYGTDSALIHTFVYKPTTQLLDTIFISIKTMGFVADFDRPLILEQILTGDFDAIAGEHYISLSDPSVTSKYFIPAGQVVAKLPIYMKRHSSLKQKSYNLKIRLVENEYFKIGYDTNSTLRITTSDQLSKPDTWTNNITTYMTGVYGQAKHQFMIDVTGQKIDADYFRSLVKPTTDVNYLRYLGNWFGTKLDEYNSKQIKPLEESDGTVVQFKRS